MDKLNPEKGFSIIEILIAMALMLIVVSGAIAGSGGLGVTINGYSSTISDSEINSEALHKAQDLIEQAAATARTSYSSVASSTSFELSSGLSYLKKLTIPVAYATQCMETVVGTVSWTGSHGRTLSVSASTTVVDVPGMFAYGGDCDITLPEDWDNPTTAASVSLGGQGATDVDADGDLVYLSSAASAPAKSDFYIYRFDTSALTLTELTSGGLNTGKGINTLDIAESYAYAANNDTTGQLLVLDVSNSSAPFIVASSTLPQASTGIIRSIAYYNDKVYVGTQYLACPGSCAPTQNNELHIYDVSTPTSPVWLGSFNVNHNINAIAVRGNYAYLATSNDAGEVMIYNVQNATAPTFAGSLDTTGNEDAQSLYLLGDRLYVGRDRTPSARQDFYIIDISNPAAPTSLASLNLGLHNNAVVEGIAVKGGLAFIALNDSTIGFRILDISNLTNIHDHAACTTLNYSENTNAMDMEGNFVFISNQSNNEIRVLGDQVAACSP